MRGSRRRLPVIMPSLFFLQSAPNAEESIINLRDKFTGGVLKYFIGVFIICIALSGLAFCQDNDDSTDYSDTSSQSNGDDNSNIDNNGIDTSRAYYSKYDTGDFRNARWGMTKAQVNQGETAYADDSRQQSAEQEGNYNSLFFRGEYAGIGTDIEYDFVTDSLVSASYVFSLDPDQNYADQFDKIKMIIEEDYWPADYDNGTWDTYGDASDLKTAIISDNANRDVRWYTDTSDITLELNADRGWVIIKLGYTENERK
jgi:hypothetical protein